MASRQVRGCVLRRAAAAEVCSVVYLQLLRQSASPGWRLCGVGKAVGVSSSSSSSSSSNSSSSSSTSLEQWGQPTLQVLKGKSGGGRG
jgi:hypothetical protein